MDNTELVPLELTTSNRDAIRKARKALLAPIVQKVDNAIHRINHYPVDSVVCLVITYPLDSDLSGGLSVIQPLNNRGQISKGKTLEPSGLNRRDENWPIYFLCIHVSSSFNFSSIFSTNHVTYISF